MANVDYDYDISDFPNGICVSRFDEEVRSSAIVTALDGVVYVGSDVTVTFKGTLSAGDVTILDGLVANHSGEPVNDPTTDDGTPIVTMEARQPDGAILVADAPRLGSETIQGTPNLCDKTTWFPDSERVVDEELSSSDGGTTWDSDHTYWIDLVHGKVLQEENIEDDYEVVVEVDDVVKTMRPPFATDWSQGGDYYVDYEDGKVIFEDAQTGTVTATYSYENGSNWYLTPAPGKKLIIEKAEIQLSTDVEMTTSMHYTIQINMGGGYFDYGETIYRSMWQIILEARGSYPQIPAIGTNSRGTGVAVTGFPFIYQAARILSSSNPPTRIRVFTGDDIAFGGSHASGTFYCMSASE